MTKKDLDEYIGEIGVYQWRVFVVVFLFTIYCCLLYTSDAADE